MDTSTYVPLSLQDTLTTTRTYRSAKAAAASSSSRPGPRPSHAAAGSYNAKERADAARREAAAISEQLGISSTPSMANLADVEATPRPSSNSAGEVAALRAKLADKDDELAALRREVAVLVKEKKDLGARVDRLEKEKAATGGNAGLDVRQLEELERQFESQERLLSGFQRESEKAAQELDKMRNRQRRLTDFLERTYGSSWQDDLGLSDKPATHSSPIARTKLVARASLSNTPTSQPPLSRLTSGHSLSSSSIPETPSQSSATSYLEGDISVSPSASPFLGAAPDEPSTASTSPGTGVAPAALPSPSLHASGLDPAAAFALKQHLEAVQTLLRSMETRLIARDVELAEMEKRAREEKDGAREREEELREMVKRLEDQHVDGSSA